MEKEFQSNQGLMEERIQSILKAFIFLNFFPWKNNHLEKGEEVILLRMQGGQKYIVLDRIGGG